MTTGLPAFDRLHDQLAGGLDAADDLDDEVDLGVVDDRGGVVGEDAGGQLDRPLAAHVAHRHPGHLEAEPGAGLDGVALGLDQPDEGGADVAAAQDPDADLAVRSWRQRYRRARRPDLLISDATWNLGISRYVPTMSSADLDTAAERLEALADVVGTGLDRMVAFHRPDVWQGLLADRFGRELDDQRALLRAAARELGRRGPGAAVAAELLRTLGD